MKFYFYEYNFIKKLNRKIFLLEGQNIYDINEPFGSSTRGLNYEVYSLIFGYREYNKLFVEYDTEEELKELEFQYTMFKLTE